MRPLSRRLLAACTALLFVCPLATPRALAAPVRLIDQAPATVTTVEPGVVEEGKARFFSLVVFARGLLEHYNVVVLPGSFLAREIRGVNPGANFVRIALVASLAECLEATQRIRLFAQQL